MNIESKEITIVDIGTIKLNPKNRNSHSSEQIERLANIIKYSGFRDPLTISNQTGVCVAGEGRYLAAKKLKMKKVPVIFQDFESEEKETAHGIAHNAIGAWSELDFSGINIDLGDLGPDFNPDNFGIKNFTVDVADKKGLCDEDEIPEHVEPRTKLGDIYQLGNHRLMCGDSTSIDAVEKLMDGQKAEICFTSPPYSDQREYGGGLELSTEHLAKFISTAFGKSKYFIVNLGYSRKNGEVNRYWDDYIKEAESCGLRMLSWNIWDRGECGSIGNQNAMFGISHEWIFVFGESIKDLRLTEPNKAHGERANHTGNRQADGTIKKGKERIIRSHSQLKTVYSAPSEKARDEFKHPAKFPVHFPEAYIEAMTDSRDSVYDPFGGSGTTLIACEKTNRKCFMMELEPKYCDVIVARWEKFTGKKAELIS